MGPALALVTEFQARARRWWVFSSSTKPMMTDGAVASRPSSSPAMGLWCRCCSTRCRAGFSTQDVHGFLKQYGGGRSRVPQRHIWVYDEAQRAWDLGSTIHMKSRCRDAFVGSGRVLDGETKKNGRWLVWYERG